MSSMEVNIERPTIVSLLKQHVEDDGLMEAFSGMADDVIVTGSKELYKVASDHIAISVRDDDHAYEDSLLPEIARNTLLTPDEAVLTGSVVEYFDRYSSASDVAAEKVTKMSLAAVDLVLEAAFEEHDLELLGDGQFLAHLSLTGKERPSNAIFRSWELVGSILNTVDPVEHPYAPIASQVAAGFILPYHEGSLSVGAALEKTQLVASVLDSRRRATEMGDHPLLIEEVYSYDL